MKKLIIIVTISIFLALTSVPLMATSGYDGGGSTTGIIEWILGLIGGGGGEGGGSGSSVPELDLAAGPVAIALILGLMGIVAERRRRNSQDK